MIVVASTTSYFVIVRPNVRIIPIVLGIFGYTYGSVLGIFLAGMLTQNARERSRQFHRHDCRLYRGRDLERTSQQSGAKYSAVKLYSQPDWLPVMEFPWWICFGTIVTFFVAILFRTDPRTSPGRSLV